MKIRELLRCEIWSKKTTRRILIGVVIFIGLIFVGDWIWNEYELHWLTSGERKAAKAALAEIDSLEDTRQLSDQEWEARQQEAKARIEATRRSAKTYRDVLVEDDLSLYLLEVSADHRNLERRRAGRSEIHLNSIFGGSTNESRLKLHKELD
jgi:hypothetical protein